VPALVALAIAGLGPVTADDKPSTWFCMKARQHRAAFTTDRAAEDAARALGNERDDSKGEEVRAVIVLQQL
jgi:hypothetical protein